MRMKKWKRVTASALSICMLATCAPGLAKSGGILQTPVTVHAETGDIIVKGDCGTHAKWNYNRTTKVLTITGRGSVDLFHDNIIGRYKTDVEKLIISDRITEIKRDSFKNFTALKDIDFGGVKIIGFNAFIGCTSLKNIDFGKVKTIESDAFRGCTSLKNIDFGKVKIIEYNAFSGCTSLKTLHLGGNIEEIGSEAFLNCKNLTSVTLGAKVKDVYDSSFKGCKKLTSISVSKDNKYVYARGKKLFTYDESSDETSRNSENFKKSGKCGKNVTYSYNPKTNTLTLSGSGPMYDGTHEVEEDLLWDIYDYRYLEELRYDVETLVVGDNITRIGTSAFAKYFFLENVKLGKNVTSIGSYAFAECDNLKRIQLGNHIKSIGEKAFFQCKKLKTFSIGESVNKIGDEAFSECTRLSKLNVHKNNTKYASKNGLLYSKNRKKLIKCPEKKSGVVHIDDATTTIDMYAFYNCNNIKQINIGKNVKSLKHALLAGQMKKLNNIQISSKNKYYYIENGSIISKANHELIYCYKIDGDTYTVPESVKKIGNYAFTHQNNLKHLILSDNITKLEHHTFDVYSDPFDLAYIKIESIHLGKQYKFSSYDIFYDLYTIRSLKEVTVSSENPNHTSIDGVLYNKDATQLIFLPGAIETYTMPESVTSFLGDEDRVPTISFYLKNLVLSDSITDATKWLNAFDKLTSVHLGKNVTKISNDYGIGQSKLNCISVAEENSTFKVVNNMLYSKDGSKFILCPAKTKGKVVLENGVTEIESYAFKNCTKITDIVIPDTVSKIDDYALDRPSTQNPEFNTVDSIVIWVPKGKLDYYKSLFTKKTGYLKNMLIMELEN